MKLKILGFFKQENGNIIILFAGTLIVLIFFLGLSLDIGMICLQRNSMQNLCQLLREDRFTCQDTIRFAENPGLASYELVYNTMNDNNFDGTVKVYFYEKTPQNNYREYLVRTELSQEYSFAFARVLGFTTTTITVSLDGGESYGEGGADVVWRPIYSVSDYNGSYTSQPDGVPCYNSSEIPPEWLS